MRDYISIGCTPAMEDCAQVGRANYHEQMRKETKAYIGQLTRMFPLPEGVDAIIKVKSFPHDFGTYHEVVVDYNVDQKEALSYALTVEADAPAHWDQEARKELGLKTTEAK